MKENCMHIWCLDHQIYFNCQTSLLKWKRYGDDGEYAGSRIFPAKCGVCKIKKTFTESEWLEHVRKYGYD